MISNRLPLFCIVLASFRIWIMIWLISIALCAFHIPGAIMLVIFIFFVSFYTFPINLALWFDWFSHLLMNNNIRVYQFLFFCMCLIYLALNRFILHRFFILSFGFRLPGCPILITVGSRLRNKINKWGIVASDKLYESSRRKPGWRFTACSEF